MAFQFNSIPKALCCGHLEAHLRLKVHENSVEKMGQEPQGKRLFSKDPAVSEKQLKVSKRTRISRDWFQAWLRSSDL